MDNNYYSGVRSKRGIGNYAVSSKLRLSVECSSSVLVPTSDYGKIKLGYVRGGGKLGYGRSTCFRNELNKLPIRQLKTANYN